MSVVTTLVLSIVSRSITDVSITTNEGESLRAFSAAEAGVERALVESISPGSNISGNLGQSTQDQDSNFTTAITSFPGSSREYVYPAELRSGVAATIWLVDHDANGDPDDSCNNGTCFTGREIRFCWATSGTNRNTPQTPAIITSIIYEDASGGPLKVATQAIDPFTSRTSSNNFSAISGQNCQIASHQFQFSKDIDLATTFGLPPAVFNTPGRLKYIRVQMLYNSLVRHSLGVRVLQGSNIPSQGKKVDSTGVAGVASRKVEVFSLFADPPSIFDSAIFSTSSLIK